MRLTAALLLSALLLPLPAAALTFDEAEKMMLAANPQAAAALQGLEAARFRLAASRAGLYPSFSADASYARSGRQGFDPADSYSYGVSGSQPLFAPALPAALRGAAASVRAAQADYMRASSSLRYQLRTVFADIQNSRETIKLSEETLKRREENLELIRLKYQAGRENKAALLETQAALKTAQWQHERYKKNLRLQERKLNRLLALPAQAEVPALEQPAVPAAPEDFSAYGARLENHNTLLSAKASLASADAAADAARGARLPEASANGSYRWSGTDWPSSLNSWSLGASVSVPLFSSGKLSDNLNAASASRAAAERRLADAHDEVFLNAEDAFLAWREAGAYLDVARVSLEAAEARAWLVRKQYLAGQASYFEWRSVEEQLIGEQNQYLSAARGLRTGYAAFAQALGE